MHPSVWRQPSFDSGLSQDLRQRARKSIFARLMNEHVKAVTVTVGKIGSLPGLKIQPVVSRRLRLGVPNHLLDIDIKGFVGCIVSRDALKPQLG